MDEHTVLSTHSPSEVSSSVVVTFWRREAQFTNGLIFFTGVAVLGSSVVNAACVGLRSRVLDETLTGGRVVLISLLGELCLPEEVNDGREWIYRKIRNKIIKVTRLPADVHKIEGN